MRGVCREICKHGSSDFIPSARAAPSAEWVYTWCQCQRGGALPLLRSVLHSDGGPTRSSGTENYASKILSEMRRRKGEEKQVASEETAPDSGSSYLSQLAMRGLKARTDDGAPGESPLQKLSQLSMLGDMNRGPGYMFLPPKEHLLEKYYVDDHLSSMERHKVEMKKVKEEYSMHEADCGSSQVQIALLTAKIKYMAEHMKVHKKDLHSRKGLEGMIEQRNELLKYLRRADWDEYCILITRLGLRD